MTFAARYHIFILTQIIILSVYCGSTDGIYSGHFYFTVMLSKFFKFSTQFPILREKINKKRTSAYMARECYTAAIVRIGKNKFHFGTVNGGEDSASKTNVKTLYW
jgi:hypothetical protein